MKDCFVIITAGGLGTRMNSSKPKQFMRLGGLPLLWHPIQRFYQALNPGLIILTLPSGYEDYWKELCANEGLDIPHKVVTGGKERFNSVKEALNNIDVQEGIVGIHDGVRPFVSEILIKKTFESARKNGAAIPAILMKDSIRKREKENWVAVNRDDFRRIQTPQVFDLKQLRKTYNHQVGEGFTDDATVWEKSGKKVVLVEGEERNFKITNEDDLEYANFLVKGLTLNKK